MRGRKLSTIYKRLQNLYHFLISNCLSHFCLSAFCKGTPGIGSKRMQSEYSETQGRFKALPVKSCLILLKLGTYGQ